MSLRRVSIYLPVVFAVLVLALIAVPLWFFFDWREDSWRTACREQGGQPVRLSYDGVLLCVDGDNRVMPVRQ